MTIPLVNKLNINLKKKSCLIGDKGYISKKIKKQLKRKDIILVTPYRKNQKYKHYIKNYKQLAKLRFKVEVVFSHF